MLDDTTRSKVDDAAWMQAYEELDRLSRESERARAAEEEAAARQAAEAWEALAAEERRPFLEQAADLARSRPASPDLTRAPPSSPLFTLLLRRSPLPRPLFNTPCLEQAATLLLTDEREAEWLVDAPGATPAQLQQRGREAWAGLSEGEKGPYLEAAERTSLL